MLNVPVRIFSPPPHLKDNDFSIMLMKRNKILIFSVSSMLTSYSQSFTFFFPHLLNKFIQINLPLSNFQNIYYFS